MMETYTTVTKEINKLWDYPGSRKSTSQSSFHEERGEELHSLGHRETLGRERAQDEADSSELTTKIFGPSLNQQEKQGATPSPSLKEAREERIFRTQRTEDEKSRQGAWQQFFLQGWERLFNPPPQQQEESVMKHQEAYSEEALKKHEEVLELKQHQLDHPSHLLSRSLRQADDEKEQQPFSGKDMAKTCYAGDLSGKERKARET